MLASLRNSNTLVFLVFSCLLSVSCSFKFCNKIDSAKFKTDEGEIDLWPLARNDGQPRFKDIPDTVIDTQFYSFNPGNSWSDTRGKLESVLNNCHNISACMHYGDPEELSHNVYVNVGTQSSVEFIHDSGLCILSVKGHYFATPTNTLITLLCDRDQEGELDDFVSDEEADTGWKYRSTLHSKYACIPYTLSIGSILLITFAGIIIVYLVVGIIFKKFKSGAKGKDVLPNVGFWSDFPYLVKDGVVFSVSYCKSKVCGAKDGYYSV